MLLNCGIGGDSWRVPWTARRSNQSILKKIRPEYSLEGLMLKLEVQYFGTWCEKLTHWKKNPDAGKDWRQEEKGTTEDEMVGWHQQLNGHEFEQVPGVGDGQWSLAMLQSLRSQESDTTEELNWTELFSAAVLLLTGTGYWVLIVPLKWATVEYLHDGNWGTLQISLPAIPLIKFIGQNFKNMLQNWCLTRNYFCLLPRMFFAHYLLLSSTDNVMNLTCQLELL